MKTITFCSFKGGTAKTSLALHLACCIEKKTKVLIIDLDPQANLSTGIGIGPDSTDTIEVVLKNQKRIREVIKPTCNSNVFLVPANAWLDGIERSTELNNDPYSHERLRTALIDLEDEYDYCYLDTPPSLGWLTQSAFFASQYSIVCATPEAYSIIALRRLSEFHESINRYHKIETLGVVLSFWHDRGAVNREFLAEIEDWFPKKLFRTKIHRDIQVSRAVLKGIPVTKFDPKSKAAQDYKKLANELHKRVLKQNQPVGVTNG